MDPFSITVGCLGLLGSISSLAKVLTSLTTKAKGARKDVEHIHNDLDTLSTCVRRLDKDQTIIRLPDDMRQTLNNVLGDCRGIIRSMKSLIRGVSSGRLRHRVKWAASGQVQMNMLRSRLDAYKASLIIVLNMASHVSLSQIEDETRAIHKDTAAIRLDTGCMLNMMLGRIEAVKDTLSSQQSDQTSHKSRPETSLQRFLDQSSEYATSTLGDGLSYQRDPFTEDSSKAGGSRTSFTDFHGDENEKCDLHPELSKQCAVTSPGEALDLSGNSRQVPSNLKTDRLDESCTSLQKSPSSTRISSGEALDLSGNSREVSSNFKTDRLDESCVSLQRSPSSTRISSNASPKEPLKADPILVRRPAGEKLSIEEKLLTDQTLLEILRINCRRFDISSQPRPLSHSLQRCRTISLLCCKYELDKGADPNALFDEPAMQVIDCNTKNLTPWPASSDSGLCSLLRPFPLQISALCLAIMAWNWAAVDHVQLLLKHGADPSLKTTYDLTPLAMAMYLGLDEVVGVLLGAGARGWDRCSIASMGLWHCAVKQHGVDLQGIRPKSLPEEYDGNGSFREMSDISYVREKSPVHKILNGHLRITFKRALWEQSAWVSYGSTALHLAAALGQLHMIDTILSPHGVKSDINRFDRRLVTALHLAAYVGNLAMVEALLLREADPNIDAGKWGTPLEAAKAGFEDRETGQDAPYGECHSEYDSIKNALNDPNYRKKSWRMIQAATGSQYSSTQINTRHPNYRDKSWRMVEAVDGIRFIRES